MKFHFQLRILWRNIGQSAGNQQKYDNHFELKVYFCSFYLCECVSKSFSRRVTRVFAASIGGEYLRSRQCEYAMVNIDTCHSPRVFAANTRISVKQPLLLLSGHCNSYLLWQHDCGMCVTIKNRLLKLNLSKVRKTANTWNFETIELPLNINIFLSNFHSNLLITNVTH